MLMSKTKCYVRYLTQPIISLLTIHVLSVRFLNGIPISVEFVGTFGILRIGSGCQDKLAANMREGLLQNAMGYWSKSHNVGSL